MGCRDHFFHVQTGQTATHLRTKDTVAVVNQITRCRIERKRLSQLLGDPGRRRRIRDVDMHHPAADSAIVRLLLAGSWNRPHRKRPAQRQVLLQGKRSGSCRFSYTLSSGRAYRRFLVVLAAVVC